RRAESANSERQERSRPVAATLSPSEGGDRRSRPSTTTRSRQPDRRKPDATISGTRDTFTSERLPSNGAGIPLRQSAASPQKVRRILRAHLSGPSHDNQKSA